MSPCFQNYNKNEGVYPNGSYFIEYYAVQGYGLTRWIYDSRSGLWNEYYQDISYHSPGKMLRGRKSNVPLRPMY